MSCRIFSSSFPTSFPKTRTLPPSFLYKVHKILITVDFPAPLTPRKPNSSPCSTEKLISSTALTSLKYFLRFETSIALSFIAKFPFVCLMELLYVQTLLDYKHLEPGDQKETVRRHVFDASTSPNFSDKCRDESLICFLKSGCATAFFKKSAFVFRIRMLH